MYTKIVLNNETLIDLTEDTVVEGAVLQGRVFHDNQGQ
jgi:hypothetical protein